MADSSSHGCGFHIEDVSATSSCFVNDIVSQSCGLTISDIDANRLILEDGGEDNAIDVDSNGNDEETVENKPFLGQIFDRCEDAYQHYNAYGLAKGFGVRKSSTTKSKITGDVISRLYVCENEGKKDPNDKRSAGKEVKERRILIVGCEARMVIKLRDKKWLVTTFQDKHCHELTSPLRRSLHRSHNQLHKTETVKNLINSFHGIGMMPAGIVKSVNVVSDRDLGVLSTNQVQSHLKVKRKSNMGQDAVNVANHFQRRRAEDPDFFFSMELDIDGTMRSMFWADARARDSYITFSDVIVFDVTYKTNRYLMPFAPFTGVNHHRQSIRFGCALLADETEETFTWLFEQWLTCMYGKASGAIITDMDGAMRNAIKTVFPNTRHRFCSWHIGRHLVENVATMREAESEFLKDYNHWFYSNEINECEIEWAKLVEKHKIDEKHWLSKMRELRIHWVPAYWRGTFTAGMTSSQRSESMNAYFDGFVNQKTSLHDFLEQYEKALADRRRKETEEDFKSKNSKATMITLSPLEKEAGKYYTRAIFGLFQAELKRSYDYWCKKLSNDGNVTTYNVVRMDGDFETKKGHIVLYSDAECVNATCDCVMFETSGILCRHILKIFEKKCLIVIPEGYIVRRWTVDARYQVLGKVPTREEGRESGVTPLRRWCLKAKQRRLDEESYNDETLFNKMEEMCDALLAEVDQKKKEKQS
ncbi:protein FAR1-RELATED SEQUENCE 5-like [Tasmannia lanceolata]|uniref:protein FAR1-RELATED SEQUENCE 5-like n=1 Tax=Tasmannia lanceolata TaxID=3420 RepID=UPI0040632FA3